MKDYRRRSREREPRNKRDDSRDRARRRRDVSLSPRRKGKVDDGRERSQKAINGAGKSEPSKTTSAPTQTDEEKKAERLAKLEAWKQKQAAERDRKQKELETVGASRSLLDEIDKKAQIATTVASPASPDSPDDDASPIPYAGKFDPKAIARKATAGSANVTKLGTDVALPDIAKAPSNLFTSSTCGFSQGKRECKWLWAL